MFKFISSRGAEMPLYRNQYFTLTDIDAMTDVDVALSAVTMADTDGDVVTNELTNPRDITVTLRIHDYVNAEVAKRYIMQFVKPKLAGTLEVDYHSRTTRITGIVSDISMDRFQQRMIFTFTLHCSNPYWRDINDLTATISRVLALHHWGIAPVRPDEPVIMGVIQDANMQTIVNDGDVEIGMVIRIIALTDPVTNPRVTIDQTSRYIGVQTVLHKGDELIISTVKGEKYATLNGQSVLSLITEGSTWLQLDVGSNNLVATADSGGQSISVQITANERYV